MTDEHASQNLTDKDNLQGMDAMREHVIHTIKTRIRLYAQGHFLQVQDALVRDALIELAQDYALKVRRANADIWF